MNQQPGESVFAHATVEVDGVERVYTYRRSPNGGSLVVTRGAANVTALAAEVEVVETSFQEQSIETPITD